MVETLWWIVPSALGAVLGQTFYKMLSETILKVVPQIPFPFNNEQ